MNALITEEQDNLIFRYIYCTYLINHLEADLQLMPLVGFKLHEPYMSFIEEILKKLRLELKEIKLEMKKHAMKVDDPHIENVEFLQYDYFVGSKQGYKRMWMAHLRNEVGRRLEWYFKQK